MTAPELVELARAFGVEYPDHSDFVDKLIATIEQVVTAFEGQQRADLLAEARETLERQQDIARNAVASRDALEKLVKTQNELRASLEQVADSYPFQPSDVTIH